MASADVAINLAASLLRSSYWTPSCLRELHSDMPGHIPGMSDLMAQVQMQLSGTAIHGPPSLMDIEVMRDNLLAFNSLGEAELRAAWHHFHGQSNTALGRACGQLLGRARERLGWVP
jgi:hypothetical protein